MITSWSLLESGKFAEVGSVAHSEFATSGSVASLRHAYIALLRLKQTDDATKLCDRVISITNGRTDTDYLFRGVSYWIANQRHKAIQDWQVAEHCEMTDAAGGVDPYLLLYYASAVQKDLALRQHCIAGLSKLCASTNSHIWPIPVGNFILKVIDSHQLFNSTSAISGLKNRELCQAYFSVASQNIEIEKQDDAKFYFSKSISLSHHSLLKPEFHLAAWECEIT